MRYQYRCAKYVLNISLINCMYILTITCRLKCEFSRSKSKTTFTEDIYIKKPALHTLNPISSRYKVIVTCHEYLYNYLLPVYCVTTFQRTAMTFSVHF